MGLIINFVVSNYIYFVIVGLLVFMALIGFIAEKTNFGRGNVKEEKQPEPTKLKEEINDNWLEDNQGEQFEEIPISDLKPVNEYASENINPDMGNKEIVENEVDNSLMPEMNIDENKIDEPKVDDKDSNLFKDAIVDPIPTLNPVIFTDPVILDNHINDTVDGKNMYDQRYEPSEITPNKDFSFDNVEQIDPSLTEPMPEFKPQLVESEELNDENKINENVTVSEIDENKPVEEAEEDVWNF